MAMNPTANSAVYPASRFRRLAVIGTVDLLIGAAFLLIISLLLSQAERWAVKYPDTAAFVAQKIGEEMGHRGFKLVVEKDQALVRLPALFPNEKDEILKDCVPANSNDLPPCVAKEGNSKGVSPDHFVRELAGVLNEVLPEFAPGSSGKEGVFRAECQRLAKGLPCNGVLVVVYIEGHADRRFFDAKKSNSNERLSLARALSVYKNLLLAQPSLAVLGRSGELSRASMESDGNDILAPSGFGCRRPIVNLVGANGLVPGPKQKNEDCPTHGASSGSAFDREFENRRVDLRIVVTLQKN
jgi:hypothetical protein